jgi:hypothetical protein
MDFIPLQEKAELDKAAAKKSERIGQLAKAWVSNNYL